MAEQGGGLFKEAKDPNGILEALEDALNQIRASNSAFSAAALPVSANTQGAYLNQVFIGMFRPDGNALPRWVGNLKQYQFKYDEEKDTLALVDALNNLAVSGSTGFILPGGVSFWTQPSDFWINLYNSSSQQISASDSPTENWWKRGVLPNGSGERTQPSIRGQAARCIRASTTA